VINNLAMVANPYIAARVTSDTKERFAALARRQGLSESALLKRLVVAALALTESSKPGDPGVVQPVAATGKISVRLRSDDLLLLRERAQARQIPTATYVFSMPPGTSAEKVLKAVRRLALNEWQLKHRYAMTLHNDAKANV